MTVRDITIAKGDPVFSEVTLAIREELQRRRFNVTQDTNANSTRNMSFFSNKMRAFRKGRFRNKRNVDDITTLLNYTNNALKMMRVKLRPRNASEIVYNGKVPGNIAKTLYYDVFMETLLEGRKDVNWSVDNGFIKLTEPEGHQLLAKNLKRYRPLSIQRYIWMEVVKHFGLLYTTKKLRPSTAYLQPRSSTCTRVVMYFMPLVIDHLDAQEGHLQDRTEKVTAMTREIKKSQMELVQAAGWIGEKGQQAILDHLDNITVGRVGYLDWVAKGDELDAFFHGMDVHSGQLLRTMADIQVWQTEEKHLVSSKIGRLRTPPVTDTAYYNKALNTINIGPFPMQFPYYGLGADALNYGSLGTIVGHEIAHALDDVLLDSDYWSMEQDGVKRIRDFLSCTVASVEEKSGILSAESSLVTIVEDAADIIGMRTALHAYKRTRSGTEPPLACLKMFNHEQLFFLAYANAWCANKPGEMRDRKHNSEKMRTIIAASNTAEFAKTWNCSGNTLMNPEQKCILW